MRVSRSTGTLSKGQIVGSESCGASADQIVTGPRSLNCMSRANLSVVAISSYRVSPTSSHIEIWPETDDL